MFHPGGGFDFVTTGGGTDTVFFDDRAGQRDVLTIADFDPLADTLDLRGAAVAETLESDTRTVLLLDGPDRDTVVLLGLSDSPLDLILMRTWIVCSARCSLVRGRPGLRRGGASLNQRFAGFDTASTSNINDLRSIPVGTQVHPAPPGRFPAGAANGLGSHLGV